MTSHIFLTKNQIHEMFSDLGEPMQQPLISPQFVDPLSPKSKDVNYPKKLKKRYFFQDDVTSPSKKDDKSTDNYSNRKISQDSIFDSKIEMKLTNNQIFLQNLTESQSSKNDKETIQKLQQQVQQQQIQIQNLQSIHILLLDQIQTLKDFNKKYQSNISDLLSSIRKLEQENQYYQEQLLKSRLSLQDQIKVTQQIKIDMENTKISLLYKDQMIDSLNNKLNSHRIDFTKSSIRRSPSKHVESITQQHHPSFSYINYRIQPHIQQRSHSSNMKSS